MSKCPICGRETISNISVYDLCDKCWDVIEEKVEENIKKKAEQEGK